MLININGQNYTTWDEVPADIKAKVAAKLPDADGNGIPDVFEGNLSSLGNLAQGATTFTSLSIDGQPVSSLGQLPPEVQELLKNTLGIAQPGSVVAPTPIPGAPAAPAAPGAVPPNAPWPLQPGQVMLNGVPTTPGEVAAPRKSWLRRLFGG